MSGGLLLFIMGRQRSGKDTAADYLVNYYGFRKASLAKPVYEIARHAFGMQGKDRGLLIDIGVKLREIDPLVFPKALWRDVTSGTEGERLPPEARIVITDTRFPNEWQFLKARGGMGVRIEASRAVRASRPGYDAEYEHDLTETQLDDAPADIVICNDATYGAFYDAIDLLATQTLGLARRPRD